MKGKRITTWGYRFVCTMKRMWNSLLYSMMFKNYDNRK